jgi:PilZ domain-containing protein
MRADRRSERRYPFNALAEIVNETEQARTSTKISDLSMHGCYVETTNPFPQGTNVTIEIFTDSESVETAATVAYLEAKRGMGLAFREMPDCYTNTLQKWLAKGTSKPAN